MSNCFICDRIRDIKQNRNPNFVMELETGYIILLGNILFPGYTVFSCKEHANELHELEPTFRAKYLREMVIVSEYVWKIFKPTKLNYELLGNGHPHLHWHIIPRMGKEEKWFKENPIWVYEEKERMACVSDEELAPLVEDFRKKIEQIRARI